MFHPFPLKGPDPFYQHLLNTQPITPGFCESVLSVSEAMAENPPLKSILGAMYPDPRSLAS